MMFSRGCMQWGLLFVVLPCARAQDPPSANAAVPDPTVQNTPALPAPSISEKWNFFMTENWSPTTLAGAGLGATVSQMTRSAPLYGKHFWRREAFLKRLGATLGDNTSENFFSDFLLASALHEDTRYIRKGDAGGIWARTRYAISRAVITRTDSGDPTFNWANVGGCAMSAGLSNAYYPAISRTPSVAAVNWGTNIASSGLSNLAPEFGPDVGRWMKRHLPFHH